MASHHGPHTSNDTGANVPNGHDTNHAVRRHRRHRSRIPKSRKDAFKSFENLVALANDQERWKLREVGKVGKHLVWRDVGEAPVLLERILDVVEHAGIGGFRAGSLAFAARSGFSLFVHLFKCARTSKKLNFAVIRHVIFSSDSFRFAAMIGWFVTSYKFILNVLPILSFRIQERREREKATQGSPGDDDATDKEGDFPHLLEAGIRSKVRRSSTDTGYSPDTDSPTSSHPALSYPPSDLESGPPSRGTHTPNHRPFNPNMAFTPIGPYLSTSSERESSPPPRRTRFSEVDHIAPDLLSHLESTDEDITPGRLSTATQTAAILAEHKGYVFKRWHATLAGALSGGVAVLMEKKERRLGISQQLFVRGLQGSYSYWSERLGISVPFGSVLVFSFCCGQIMYGFLLRPDTTPRSYNTWIQQASIVPEEAVTMNRQLVYTGQHDPSLLSKLADGTGKLWNGPRGSIVTPENRTTILEHLELATAGKFGPPMAPCAAIHPHFNSCKTTALMRIWEVGKWMAPIYGALHFIPMLLFKRKAVAREPSKMLLRALLGTLRSASFLGIFVSIYQSYICLLHFVYELPLPEFIKRHLLSKPLWWLGGILSGLSLLVEERRRRAELAMYVLPKGLESAWKLVRGELFGIPTKRKRGWKSDSLLCAVGMSMVMTTYQHNPDHLSGLVRRLLYQFVGAN